MTTEDFRLSFHEAREVLIRRLDERPPSRIQLLAGPRQVAEILGLNRNTLRKKLADLGIDQGKKRAGREDRALDGK